MASARNQHVILNSDTAPTRLVDARLDRHDHTGLQFGLFTGTQPRCLVDFEANSMAQTVTEPLAKSRFGDDSACHAINLATGDPGLNRPDRRHLSL